MLKTIEGVCWRYSIPRAVMWN